jgi:hypothetical protein
MGPERVCRREWVGRVELSHPTLHSSVGLLLGMGVGWSLEVCKGSGSWLGPRDGSSAGRLVRWAVNGIDVPVALSR